jgi:hypothetical protein
LDDAIAINREVAVPGCSFLERVFEAEVKEDASIIAVRTQADRHRNPGHYLQSGCKVVRPTDTRADEGASLGVDCTGSGDGLRAGVNPFQEDIELGVSQPD